MNDTEPDQDPGRPIRVLVAAHQASERGGGAGALPLRLFGRLRARVEERYDWDELTGQRLRIYRQLVPAP